MIEPPVRAEARRLWEFFTGNGYTEETLASTFGSAEPPSQVHRVLPRVLALTRGGTVFDLLVRWFFSGRAQSEEEIGNVLPDWFLSVAEGAGLLRRRDGVLHPEVLITVIGRLLAASDPFDRLASENRGDHVLAINPAARYLAAFAMRHRVGTILDLGTGNGVQALAAAGRCDRITATDLNPRATAYAEFNARLNGFTNIECLTGDAFGPVAGRRFDRILCNPPFVLSPGRELICRESGEELDGFCRRLVTQAPVHLEEGGVFQMILEWVEIEGETWKDRITAWFEGAGCDAIVLRNYSDLPSSYALNRIAESSSGAAELDLAAHEEWVRFLTDRKVATVHGGLIAMRRRAGSNWVRIDDRAPSSESPFGHAVWSAFLARDFLLGPGAEDDRLLAARPVLADGIRMSQEYEPSRDGWSATSFTIRQTFGMRYEIRVGGSIASFLGTLDGNRSLDDLVEDAARREGVDPAVLRPRCLATVREMIANGFVLAGRLPA